ncbi:MAG: hypothetical protein RI894_173, partial [Bacteroidota bacterium]
MIDKGVSLTGAAVPILTPIEESIRTITGDFKLTIHLNSSVITKREREDHGWLITSQLDKAKSGKYDAILTPEGGQFVDWDELDGLQAAGDAFKTRTAPKIAELFVKKLAITLNYTNSSTAPIAIQAELLSGYVAGNVLNVRLTFRLPQGASIKCSDLSGFTISVKNNLETYSGAELKALKITATTASYPNLVLLDKPAINAVLDTSGTADYTWFSSVVEKPSATGSIGTNTQTETQTNLDLRAVRGLLRHLNEHTEYYHAAIWRNLDDYRRYNLLDGMAYNLPNDRGGYDWVSVASIVENNLIDIVGNSLVFPVAKGLRLNPVFEADVSLTDYYHPVTPPEGFGISVPTPGVFADAILGACNAAELIDDTRAQDWTKFTADEPTGINPLDTSSRYQAPPNMTAKDMPQPIVNIQNAPAAPDPQGMNALSGILGNSNLFRDATGMEALSKLTGEQQRAVVENNAKVTESANRMAELAHDYEMNKQAV